MSFISLKIPIEAFYDRLKFGPLDISFMPAETRKIAHLAGALKKIIFAQKSQFFFSTIDIS